MPAYEELRQGSRQVQAKPNSAVQHLVEQCSGKHWASGASVASCPVVVLDLPQHPFVGYRIVRTEAAVTVLGAAVGYKAHAGVKIEAGWFARTEAVPATGPLQPGQKYRGCNLGQCCIAAAELADSAFAVLAGQSSCSVPSSQTPASHKRAVKRAIVVEWCMYSVAAAAAGWDVDWDAVPDSDTPVGVLAAGAAGSFGSFADAVAYYVLACSPALSLSSSPACSALVSL
jgi:hypothetical protein